MAREMTAIWARRAGITEVRMGEIQDKIRKKIYEVGIGTKDKLGGVNRDEAKSKTLGEVLRRFDADQTGKMAMAEFHDCLRTHLSITFDMVPDNEVAAVFKAIDDDDSGMVGIEEFVQFVQITASMLKTLQMRMKAACYGNTDGADWTQIIKKHDKDKSGRLEYEEFRVLCRKDLRLPYEDFPDCDIQAVFEKIDTDDEGTCDIQELVDFIEEAAIDETKLPPVEGASP